MNAVTRPPLAIARAIAALPVFRVEGRDQLFIRAGTTIGETAFRDETPVDLPELVAGADYAVTLDAGKPSARIAPDAAPENTVGGFHFAPGGGADGTKGGDDVPAINPFSCWDAGFRPACPDPRGMALVAGRFWCDIYLTAAVHAGGTSRFNTTIADGNDTPQKIAGGEYARFDFETARVVLAAHGKQLLTAEEFFAAAYGVTERSAAGRDPKVTGLDAPRTSRWGIMQATGNMWTWGTDGHPDDPRASIFGGSWLPVGFAGSRRAYLGFWPESSDGDFGARGRSDHLTLA